MIFYQKPLPNKADCYVKTAYNLFLY